MTDVMSVTAYINCVVGMYYRRWTRMHLTHGLKYFSKYGVLHPKYDRYTYLLAREDPEPVQPMQIKKKPYKDKDFDTKLINSLFAKYPDLKYEPISQQQFPGRPLNTFSYAFSFITDQKKLIKQGYSIAKAFELTQEKYHERMKRKMDQTLLSRGLAMSNRARSFLSVYQQQAEYEARLKTLRTKRELEKYEIMLQNIRDAVESEVEPQAQDLLGEELLSHERISYEINQSPNHIDYSGQVEPMGYRTISDKDGPERTEQVDRLESRFRHLFQQFYEHAATKDRLEGLSDGDIIKQIQSSPNKMKKNMRELMKYLNNRGLTVKLSSGKVIIEGQGSELISEEVRNNKYLKIALLADSLDYQKPVYSSAENPTKIKETSSDIMKQREELRKEAGQIENKSTDQKAKIRESKKNAMEYAVDEELFYQRQAYKVFETNDERMLRLQLKYYDKLGDQIRQTRQEGSQSQEDIEKREESLKKVENLRKRTIEDFRRLKFRLEKRYRNKSADELLFPEHQQMGKSLHFEEDVEYEELIGYLRRKSEERRMTAMEQSKDSKISNYVRVAKIGEKVVAEGQQKRQAD